MTVSRQGLLTQRKHRHLPRKRIIPERDQEKQSVQQKTPHRHIGAYSRSEGFRPDDGGAVDEGGYEGEGEGCSYDGVVDEAGGLEVAEVEGDEVAEVEEEDGFGEAEVGVAPEGDEGGEEGVVGYEVGADVCGGGDEGGVEGGEEVDVAELEGEEETPGLRGGSVFLEVWRVG